MMKARVLIPIAAAVFGFVSGFVINSGNGLGGNAPWCGGPLVGISAAYADDDEDSDHSEDKQDHHRPNHWGGEPPPPTDAQGRPLPPPNAPLGPPPGMMGGGRPGWLLGRDFEDHDQARAAVQAGQVLPLRDIMAVAERDFEGHMLEAELEHEDGEPWQYELKMLAPDGSILKLYYDAARPELVKAKGHGLLRWYKGDPNALPPALEDAKRRMGSHHEGRGSWTPHGKRDDRDGKDDREDSQPSLPQTGHAPPPPPSQLPWYDRWLHWLGVN